MIQPLVYTDFYKTDHRRQYPKGTQEIYSNFTPRASRLTGCDHVVVFGIQYFLKEYLVKRFNEEFFMAPRSSAVNRYKHVLDNALGPDAVPMDHIYALHDLGYLPIRIKALPEGSRVPIRVPVLTMVNTHPDFFWVTNFLETILSNILWGPMTSATIAYQYRSMFDYDAKISSDIPEFVDWQGHDFSFRGMYGLEAACLSGAAHLLSFRGTDTIPAIEFLQQYYPGLSPLDDPGIIGGSVPATEHSVMCAGGLETERETIKRLITEIYPAGIVSIVSDTWDYWKVIDEIAPSLKAEILARNGKVVFRPDSGDPREIIPETISRLYKTFGGEYNSKGYIQLNPKVGVIYGDAITLAVADHVNRELMDTNFASTNIVYGIGSYTYQYNTRDTFGFAMKATHAVIDGKDYPIFKHPKTDDGEKNSARGYLRVEWENDEFFLEENVSRDREGGCLTTVFENSRLVKFTSLNEIRNRLLKHNGDYVENPTALALI